MGEKSEKDEPQCVPAELNRWWLRTAHIDWYNPDKQDELLLKLIEWRPGENGSRY